LESVKSWHRELKALNIIERKLIYVEFKCCSNIILVNSARLPIRHRRYVPRSPPDFTGPPASLSN
jgi:hypothetical protein